jgi:hypothetical protein
MAPLNIEEAALSLESRLGTSDAGWFQPIPTGFPDLDRLLGGGLHAGDLHLLGGPQNIGKTSMTLQMAAAIAGQGALALVINYEHSVDTLWERLLCQSAYAEDGEARLTADDLNDAYIAVVRARDGDGDPTGEAGLRNLDRVLGQVPSGLAAWSRLSATAQNIWLVSGHGLYTTVDAMAQYLDFAFTLFGRVVLIVDYVQEVPVISLERPLTAEERIERALAGLKGLGLQAAHDGKVLSVIAVAAADAEGLRKGRVHFENLWGNATIQYKPDVAWIGNRDGIAEDGVSWVRWAVEKNRRGPSDLEFRFRYHGAAYAFESEGVSVRGNESWQTERSLPEGEEGRSRQAETAQYGIPGTRDGAGNGGGGET